MHGSLRQCLREFLYVIVVVEILIVLFIFQGAFIDSTKSTKEIDMVIPLKSLVDINFQSALGVSPEVNRNHSLTCREIDHMVLDRPVGRGTTKTAFKSTFAGQTVVVKMVTENVKDIVACKKKKGAHNINSCFKFAQYKIMKEIALLEQLRHPNVAQLLGSCIRNEVDKNDRVVVVMELGKPVDTRRMGWPMRLQTALNMAELLHYFHNSPIGSIRIGDFKRDQFRLINGTVKISDLDDLTVEEQSCDVASDCLIMGKDNGVPCIQSVCKDFNTIANIQVANKIFFRPIFSKAPSLVQEDSDDLLRALSTSSLDTDSLRNRIQSIQRKYKDSSANR